MMIDTREITDRQEWLTWRRRNINASEIGIIAGAETFKTPLRLWAEKSGEVEEDEMSAIMQRGIWLEPAVIAAARDHHPDWIIVPPKVYLQDTAARIGCTPDAVAETASGTVIIQCKVISRPVFDRDFVDGPPFAYVLQALTEAMLWGASRALLAVLVIDTFTAQYREFPIDRHGGAERKIRAMVAQFWADTEAGTPPKANYAKDLGLLTQLHPPTRTEPLDLTGDNRMAQILEDRAGLKDTIKSAEAGVVALDAEIIEKLNGATVAFTREWKITRKDQTRAEHVVPANTFPVMRITKQKEPAK